MRQNSKTELKSLLESEGFTFKKSLGQNFITDPSVCPRMAQSAADKDTGIIEIGPGAGVLTCCLCEAAKKVVAIEIDERLKPVLDKTLSGYDNVKVIFADVLKTDLNALISQEFSDCKRVNICANLPYYITSPILMGILSSKPDIESVTAMVQKEAALRICAEVGTRAAGAVTAAVDYLSDAEILFDVNKECFLPMPKVDSAVIRLTLRKEPKVKVLNEEMFFKTAKACFAQRRKTLLNTVSSTLGIDKNELRRILAVMNLSESVRGENLTLEQLARLSDEIFKSIKGDKDDK